MKILRLVPLVTVAALALSGCAGGSDGGSTSPTSPQKGGNISVTLPSVGVPPTLDAMSTSQRVAGMAAAQACEGLFASTSKLGVKEGLVDTWTYDEAAKTYHFGLRQGVLFHDGTELKAADVVASLERFAKSAPGATFGALFDSVKAADEYNVDLILKAPSGAIPALLATPDTAAYIMPASLVAGKAPTDALQTLVCTGPYKLDSYVPEQSLIFSRFDDYKSRTEASDGAAGAKTAWADTITFVPGSSANVTNLVSAGQVDVVSQFPLDQVQSIASNPSVKTVVMDNGTFPLLQFNTRAGLMANQKLRQAVQSAFDNASILAAAASDAKYTSLDSSLMPEGSPWYSQEGSSSYNAADVTASKKLQQESGYNGEPIELMYQASDTYSPVVVQQLKAAGFNIKDEIVDSATYTARRADDKKWDLFISGGTSYGDPLTVVFMGANFPGWWNTPEKKALMAEFTAGATQETRKVAWDKLQALIYEQVPFVRFGGRAQVDAISSKISDYPEQLGSARGFYNVTVQP